MKQKIVIKVQMHCDKCRKKAMKIAAVAHGVSSVAIGGKERDEVVVIGEEIDSAYLTCLLRKKLGYASILSVGEDKKKEEEEKKKKEEEEKKKQEELCKYLSTYCKCAQCTGYYGVVVSDQNPSGCSII